LFGRDHCISVTSNIAPGLCRNLLLAWKQGYSVRAQRLARAIAELTSVLFRETNPVPLKQALALLGLMSSAVRLPLVGLSEPHRIELSEVLVGMCHEHVEQMIGTVKTASPGQRAAVG
jgi:4-hydroxy-tetrahydrodipicolinate synthase